MSYFYLIFGLLFLFSFSEALFIVAGYSVHLNGYNLQPLVADTNSYGLGGCYAPYSSPDPYFECYFQHNIDPASITDVSLYFGAEGTTGSPIYVLPSSYYSTNPLIEFVIPFEYLNFFGTYLDSSGFPGFEFFTPQYGNLDYNSVILLLFKYGYFYVQINTNAYPNGAIRGQFKNTDRFGTLLTWDQVIPIVDIYQTINHPEHDNSQNTGVLLASYTSNSPRRTLTFYGIHNVLNPTGIDFRYGSPTQNGPFAFSLNDYQSPIYESIQITFEEELGLYGEYIYSQIYSTDNPEGDIRGQIFANDAIPIVTHTSRLSGYDTLPNPQSTYGRGCALLSYNCTTNLLEYLIFHNVPNPTRVFFWNAIPDVVGIDVFEAPSAISPIYASVFLTEYEQFLLYNDSLYITIESEEYPTGAVRGQVSDQYPYYAYLSGINMNPPVTTGGVGCATFRIVQNSGYVRLDYDIEFRSSNPVRTLLYDGAFDVNGKVNRILGQTPYQYIVTGIDQPLNAHDITYFTTSRMYIQINTEAFPDGEIRGQIYKINSTACTGTFFNETITPNPDIVFAPSTHTIIIPNNSNSLMLNLLFIIFSIILSIIFF